MPPLEKQKIRSLLFYVYEDDEENTTNGFEDSLISEVEDLIKKIAGSREWILGPPVFVNEEDEGDGEDGEDDTLYILGGLFRLYSSYAPERLPRDVERIHFEEVKEIVEQVRRFSSNKQIVFAFELDQDDIGRIENGILDKFLRVGLLEEWEKALQGDLEGG